MTKKKNATGKITPKESAKLRKKVSEISKEYGEIPLENVLPKENPKEKTTSQKMADILKEEEIDFNKIMIEQIESGKRPVSQSAIKKFLESPRSMYNYYHGEKKDKTPQMILGSAYEIMLMEPDIVDDKIIEMPDYSGKGSVALKNDFKSAHLGKIILSPDDFKTCLLMYQRAHRDEELQEILSGVVGVQEEVFYTHKPTGIRCIAKIDFRTPMDEMPFKVIDLKTFGGSAMPNNFARQMYSLGYWIQGGAYFSAYRHKYYLFPDYYWLVQETSAPYDINYFKADDDLIREGERVWDYLLQALKFCCENRYWHLGHKFWRLMMEHDTIRMPKYHVLR